MKNTIKIEGQDNNVADVLDRFTESTFMSTTNQTLVSMEMYGVGDNPRWLGAEITTQGDYSITNEILDSFRVEFPNVNAEVAS